MSTRVTRTCWPTVMRNYRAYAYPPRKRDNTGLIITAIVVLCIVIVARLDYITQRDCGSNQACLNAVM